MHLDLDLNANIGKLSLEEGLDLCDNVLRTFCNNGFNEAARVANEFKDTSVIHQYMTMALDLVMALSTMERVSQSENANGLS